MDPIEPTVVADDHKARVRLARGIALTADFLQIIAFPLFGPGFASPANNVLDMAVAFTMWRLLGWHWALLPSFVAEALPMFDLVPTWTAAVFLVTSGAPLRTAVPPVTTAPSDRSLPR